MLVNQTNTVTRKDNKVMDDLAVYGVARDVAKKQLTKYGSDTVIEFSRLGSGYEVQASKADSLAGYNTEFAIIPGDGEFNLISRKENVDSIRDMPKDKLRKLLTKIVDAA